MRSPSFWPRLFLPFANWAACAFVLCSLGCARTSGDLGLCSLSRQLTGLEQVLNAGGGSGADTLLIAAAPVAHFTADGRELTRMRTVRAEYIPGTQAHKDRDRWEAGLYDPQTQKESQGRWIQGQIVPGKPAVVALRATGAEFAVPGNLPLKSGDVLYFAGQARERVSAGGGELLLVEPVAPPRADGAWGPDGQFDLREIPAERQTAAARPALDGPRLPSHLSAARSPMALVALSDYHLRTWSDSVPPLLPLGSDFEASERFYRRISERQGSVPWISQSDSQERLKWLRSHLILMGALDSFWDERRIPSFITADRPHVLEAERLGKVARIAAAAHEMDTDYPAPSALLQVAQEGLSKLANDTARPETGHRFQPGIGLGMSGLSGSGDSPHRIGGTRLAAAASLGYQIAEPLAAGIDWRPLALGGETGAWSLNEFRPLRLGGFVRFEPPIRVQFSRFGTRLGVFGRWTHMDETVTVIGRDYTGSGNEFAVGLGLAARPDFWYGKPAHSPRLHADIGWRFGQVDRFKASSGGETLRGTDGQPVVFQPSGLSIEVGVYQPF